MTSDFHIHDCPDCDGGAIVTCLDPGDGLPPYWVECEDCERRSDSFDDTNEAVLAWNELLRSDVVEGLEGR